MSRRALHWVFKIGHRQENINFFKNILGMKILRHEEFDQGCEATCNGPYDGKWSKTMIGYDHEDTHFVAELTYNYGIESYCRGNDLLGLHVESTTAFDNIKQGKYPVVKDGEDEIEVHSPDGYPFFVRKGDGQLSRVSIAVSDMKTSMDFWINVLSLGIYGQHKADEITLAYDEEQCKLQLIQIGCPIVHNTAIGRIAFACPWDDQELIRNAVKSSGQGKVLTDLTELPTPGKATVRVLILTDPDGYEICFVGDEGFRMLSQFDPKAEDYLTKSLSEDKSDEWFASKGKSKAQV